MARHIDSEMVPHVHSLSSIPSYRQRDGVDGRYFGGLDTLVGVTTIEPGAEPNPHSHPWEQIVFVLDGTCKFRVGKETLTVREEDLLLVPPGYEHSAKAMADGPCRLLFSGPLREDHLSRTDYQPEFADYEEETN